MVFLLIQHSAHIRCFYMYSFHASTFSPGFFIQKLPCQIEKYLSQSLKEYRDTVHIFIVDGRFCKRTQNLVAAIYGGVEVIRGVTENITMNGSLSYDPETGDNEGMNFTWRYGTIPRSNHSSLQFLTQGSFTHVNGSTIKNIGTSFGRTSSINSNFTNENDTLIIKLTIAKDYRTSSVIQVVHLVEGSPPRIYQRYGALFFPIRF